MANVLTAAIPQIMAGSLKALRRMTVLTREVNSRFETEVGAVGSKVTIPITSAITAYTVSPSVTHPTPSDQTPTSIDLELDQWKGADFHLTDKDLLELKPDHLPLQAERAVEALAEDINAYLFGLYKQIYGYVGTAGTTPFGSDITELVAARRILNEQKAPPNNRICVTNDIAEEKLLNRSNLQKVNESGGSQTLREGQVGRLMSFDMFADPQIPLHTAGSITTGLTCKASTAQAVGDTTLVCTTAASTGQMDFKEGDIFTIAGDTQTYRCTTAVAEATAATDVTINIEPGLKVAVSGGEALTLKATHRANLALHRECIGFGMRPMAKPPATGGNTVSTWFDDFSGLSLRLEISRHNKMTIWTYDVLYGARVIRPELGCRIAGEAS